MSSPIITKVIEEMNDLSDDLQQKVLKFVVALRQQHFHTSGNAWDLSKSLTGTVEAPAIGQLDMTITSTALPNIRKQPHDKRSPLCSSRLSCPDAEYSAEIKRRSPSAPYNSSSEDKVPISEHGTLPL